VPAAASERSERSVNPACYVLWSVHTGLILYRTYWADRLQFSS
jgi:hypothetical protein